MVATRGGVTGPFTQDKIIRGVQRARAGRLAMLAQRAEKTIRARGLA